MQLLVRIPFKSWQEGNATAVVLQLWPRYNVAGFWGGSRWREQSRCETRSRHSAHCTTLGKIGPWSGPPRFCSWHAKATVCSGLCGSCWANPRLWRCLYRWTATGVVVIGQHLPPRILKHSWQHLQGNGPLSTLTSRSRSPVCSSLIGIQHGAH